MTVLPTRTTRSLLRKANGAAGNTAEDTKSTIGNNTWTGAFIDSRVIGSSGVHSCRSQTSQHFKPFPIHLYLKSSPQERLALNAGPEAGDRDHAADSSSRSNPAENGSRRTLFWLCSVLQISSAGGSARKARVNRFMSPCPWTSSSHAGKDGNEKGTPWDADPEPASLPSEPLPLFAGWESGPGMASLPVGQGLPDCPLRSGRPGPRQHPQHSTPTLPGDRLTTHAPRTDTSCGDFHRECACAENGRVPTFGPPIHAGPCRKIAGGSCSAPACSRSPCSCNTPPHRALPCAALL